MVTLVLNSIALDPHRWTKEKVPFHKLEQLLAPIAQTGFRFVEIWQHHISEETEAQISAIRAAGNSLGVSFPVVGLYPQLHVGGEECRREGERTNRLLSYAKILGADIVKVFAGSRDSALITPREYELSVEAMKQMTQRAESLDLTITGETHPNTLFDTVGSCRRFMQDVQSDRFKICFQPFDLRDTNQAIRDYELVAADVIHVHYQGRKGDSMELLENADLDHRRLTRALAHKGFSGYLCIEFTKDCVVENPVDFNLEAVLNNARRDRDFVLKLGQELQMRIQG
ncbi:MAG: sugar phosphate isomerase/epimerase [Ignavibacteriae bacterium]|nr:sugar phosphate isomerase/epimerase [Ignavibacteriota bacterium]